MIALRIVGIIGVAQLVYLLFLASAKSQKNTRYALSLVLLSAHLLLLCSSVFYAENWYQHFPHFLYVRVPVPLLIGPSLYLLVRYWLGLKPVHWKRMVLHALPFVLYIVAMLPFYALAGAEKMVTSPMELSWINFKVLEHGKMVHMTIYLLFVIVLLKRNWSGIADSWTRRVVVFGLLTYALIVIMSVTNAILIETGITSTLWSDFTNTLLLTSLAYLLSHGLASNKFTFINPVKRLSGDSFNEVVKRFEQLMHSQKYYRMGDLKIARVARELGVSRNTLSAALNQEYQCSFSQRVNLYRVDDFKERIQDTNQSHKTLLGLALESGFNSKTSFQRVFKESTGLTPTDYRNSLKK